MKSVTYPGALAGTPPSGVAGSTSQDDAQSSAHTAGTIAARMDRMPATRHFWKMAGLVSLGGWFEFYDLIFTGYIAPGLAKAGLLTTTTQTFFGYTGIAGFIAATFAGLFVGTFFCGRLADRFGRRSAFTGAMVWYSVASAIMAFQNTPEGLLIWRFIAGIGLGVEIVTVTTYLVEMVPAHMRGKAIALNQAIMFTAAPIVSLLASFLVPQAPLGLDGWRWIVLIGTCGAIIVGFLRKAMPETPRWLVQHGRGADADRVVSAIEAKVAAETGRPLPAPAKAIEAAPVETAGFLEMWTGPYRSRVLMLLVFNFFQAIGYYGFANWVPTLLIAKGVLVTKSLMYATVIAIASPVGPLLAMTVADRIQRKWLIVICAGAIAAIGTLFAQTANPVLLIVLGVLINLFNSTLSLCYHTYQNEVFPTRIRARAAGVVYSFSRLGAMFSGFVIAHLLRDHGVTGVFAAIVGCMVIVMIVIGLFGPATNSKSLEEISH
ncbi:MFS transporter [Noviherbaspirillum galbum]|uniref:MFS transporter n=1 Tax=Noviherbaspirillum galbum TaxID=2709383 RepID=A0A6B3SVE2_9BURK|nr:MFS transporter [Noviherbaspirillum galbum]NEX64783.1 MFS transporter [Noviherbaspirillum galbum]